MSIKVMSWVWDNAPYAESALLLLLALGDWCDDSGVQFRPRSVEALATRARLKKRATQYLLAGLIRDGVVRREAGGRGRGDRSLLRIVMDPSEWVQGIAPLTSSETSRSKPERVQGAASIGVEERVQGAASIGADKGATGCIKRVQFGVSEPSVTKSLMSVKKNVIRARAREDAGLTASGEEPEGESGRDLKRRIQRIGRLPGSTVKTGGGTVAREGSAAGGSR